MHGMDCEKILDLLSGRLDGSLEEPLRTEVGVHLRDCPRCAAEEEALKETLALLRNLPPEKAPPELLEGVRRRIAAERRPDTDGRSWFASTRFRIPLEAAAAVLLFLLVYGIQRQLPVAERPATAPVRVESTSPSEQTVRVGEEPARTPATTAAPQEEKTPPALFRKRDTQAASTGRVEPGENQTEPYPDSPRGIPETPAPRSEPVGAREAIGPVRDRIEEVADRIEAAVPGKEEPIAAKASLPAVPATRVSTGAEPVAPRAREEERSGAPAPFRIFAAPPSRLLRPLPYGRDLILEVAAGDRPGVEDRIVGLVERFGGSVLREFHFRGAPTGEAAGMTPAEGPVRVQLPADSAESFLSELRNLGTIPAEGMPANLDLPAGPTADTIAYTIRIRVR